MLLTTLSPFCPKIILEGRLPEVTNGGTVSTIHTRGSSASVGFGLFNPHSFSCALSVQLLCENGIPGHV